MNSTGSNHTHFGDLVAPLVKQGGLDLGPFVLPPWNLHPNHTDYIVNTLFTDSF